MSKYCVKCGNELNDGVKFCPKCGASADGDSFKSSMGAYVSVEKRDIAIAIVLSLVTCGIYGIIWFVKMTDDAKALSGADNASGGLAFVYSLITCGFYQLYWYYKMGKNMSVAGEKTGVHIDDNAIVYLLLGFFGLGIVSYALIQNDLNKFASN